MPGKFFIMETGSNKEATAEQIRDSPVDPIDGLLPVSLNDLWIKTLPAFLEQRKTAIIFQAVGNITDAKLRGEVLKHLQKIFGKSEIERIAAAGELLTMTSGSLENSYQISAALSRLTDRSGYQDHPLLILVKANIAFTDYQMKSGPGYDVDVLTLLAEAVRKANDNFNFGFDKSLSAMSRKEMSLVNGRARYLYGQLNKPQEATERQWIERFYGMTDEERKTFDEGDIIELIPPGVTVMKAPSQSIKDLGGLDKEWEDKQNTWEKTDRIGSQTVATDHRADELYQNANDFYEFQRAEREKRRKNQSRASVRYKLVTVDVEMYEKPTCGQTVSGQCLNCR